MNLNFSNWGFVHQKAPSQHQETMATLKATSSKMPNKRRIFKRPTKKQWPTISAYSIDSRNRTTGTIPPPPPRPPGGWKPLNHNCRLITPPPTSPQLFTFAVFNYLVIIIIYSGDEPDVQRTVRNQQKFL